MIRHLARELLGSKYGGIPYAAFGGSALGGITVGQIFPEGSTASFVSASVAGFGLLGIAGCAYLDEMSPAQPSVDTNPLDH